MAKPAKAAIDACIVLNRAQRRVLDAIEGLRKLVP